MGQDLIFELNLPQIEINISPSAIRVDEITQNGFRLVFIFATVFRLDERHFENQKSLNVKTGGQRGKYVSIRNVETNKIIMLPVRNNLVKIEDLESDTEYRFFAIQIILCRSSEFLETYVDDVLFSYC